MTRSTDSVGRAAPVRPKREDVGAMTRAMNAVRSDEQGERVLRVAHVLDGKVIAERRVRREDVTVGTSPRADFTLKRGPERHALFVHRRGELRLVPPPGAEVKVTPSLEDGALTQDARGRVKLADGSVVLFQRVAAPPAIVRVRLPSSAQGGFSRNVDWTFTAFVVATAMFMTGFLIALENHDWPIENTLASRIRNFEAVFDEPPMPEPEQDWAQEEPEPDTDTNEVATTEPEPSEATTEPTPSRNRGEQRSESAADREARIAQARAEAEAQILVLGARLDQEGAFRDLVGAGAPIANAEEVLRQVDGVSLHASNDIIQTRRGGNSAMRCIGTRCLSGGMRGAPMEARAGEEIIEREIRSTVRISRAEPLDPGEFDDRLVISRVRGKQRAVQACYNRILGRHPDTSGRVTVELTIQRAGNVRARAVSNSTNSSDLAACITRRLNSIRFAQGPERPVDYQFPFIFHRE